MRPDRNKPTLRCAIYTRVSTEHGLEQEFNSLDNQREASDAYVKSQAHEGWKLIRTRYDDGAYSGGSMERPALKRLLDDVRAHRVDVIVVYKVDRLTRSLADFAKLVELFDAHQASFVSVTQAFNTTNSMGRLTLNVLLSFAQFEREVTGERIRDKIAASKKKGIWMGGIVPLGYRVENRALHVVEEHAAFVRGLFRRYREIGSVVRLKAILDQENLRLPIRTDRTGKATGGGLISRGHLYKILSNPMYVGRLTHKGQVHDGVQDPIVDQETWDRAQLLLAEHTQRTTASCQNSDALLAGKLFDDRGNRMSPSHAAKGERRWRYYVSQAILQGRKQEAGSVARVPALEIERRVTEALRAASSASDRERSSGLHSAQRGASGCGTSSDLPAVRLSAVDLDANLGAAVERVVVSRTTIEIELADLRGPLVGDGFRRARRRRQGGRPLLDAEPHQSRADPLGRASYKVEPYVVAADIYESAPHIGRGGWTWYTGSAGWMQRAGVESILGLRIRGAFLHLDPCIPKSWATFEMTVRRQSARYEFTVDNPAGVSQRVC